MIQKSNRPGYDYMCNFIFNSESWKAYWKKGDTHCSAHNQPDFSGDRIICYIDDKMVLPL